MQPTFLLLWAASLSSAELFVNYDAKLEDRPRVYTVVKEAIGRLDIPSKSNSKNNDSKVPLGIDLKARETLDNLLGKRQSCPQGFGYCPSESASNILTETFQKTSLTGIITYNRCWRMLRRK